ncbi:Dam family site-specific DNA-(adenine-N6)-methyltransferase [Lacibacter sediminis]|uniref:Site-specific DNA-methyltransferase (adenine-specific) n=1 Tax=Lacibacter sediminis TaxID=2760713 RepID=A0A7G5XMP5_9BACT|nr:Dam family site-specific DNA-(adenine-N6)-methyltransferase [Lacibacter sediminis]
MKVNSDPQIVPFLKWPGGKRWFVNNYCNLLPSSYNTYIEPFLGSGAVYFYLKPNKAILSDLNPDVIAVYGSIKTDFKFIKRSLQYHQRKHNEDYYYQVRKKKTISECQQGSKMLYLNRTCFNGIYRVNQNGEFNVPIGSKQAVLLDTDNFESISKLLQSADIFKSDFEVVIDKAKSGDFVFADPPYTVRHNLNGFIKYNEQLFSWEDQERLAAALLRAKNRGVKIVLTNANHSSIKELYEGLGFHLQVVSRYSSIAANGANRKQFEELVILSHPNK